jgi:hypothetical protein
VIFSLVFAFFPLRGIVLIQMLSSAVTITQSEMVTLLVDTRSIPSELIPFSRSEKM